MKNSLLQRLVIIPLLFFAFFSVITPSSAQQTAKPTDDEKVILSWQSFQQMVQEREQKVVLPLTVYQKLLAFTDTADISTVSMAEGTVSLSQSDFEKLVSRMKKPEVPKSEIPYDFLITKSIYNGIMGINATNFDAILTLHVLKSDSYLNIPVLRDDTALEQLTINGSNALVITKNGYHNITVDKPGEYTIRAKFSLRSSLDKGPHRLEINIVETAITIVNFSLPRTNMAVDILEAQHITDNSKANESNISAIINKTAKITVEWQPKLKKKEIIPAKIYAENYHLISIHEDVLRTKSEIHYNVLHSNISQLQLLIPDQVNILNVSGISGDAIGEWREETLNEKRHLIVPLGYERKGKLVLVITSEKPLAEENSINEIKGLQTLSTIREIGFAGIELNTSAEVKIIDLNQAEKIAPQRLPELLYNQSVKPLIHAFKYVKQPFSVTMTVTKHKKVEVPLATIDNANMLTLFTEDGVIVQSLKYQVRNSAKQFLEIQLPQEAELWSVFVDEQPMESSINNSGKLLVPLIRSQKEKNRLKTFPVEIIYALSRSNFSPLGYKSSQLPKVDMLISQLLWSVYLPNDYHYFYFTSSLEKEEIIRGVNIFTEGRVFDSQSRKKLRDQNPEKPKNLSSEDLDQVYRGQKAQSSFRNFPDAQEQVAEQMVSELEFDDRLSKQANAPSVLSKATAQSGTGVLPIHIKINTNGQVYRFGKSLIRESDSLFFTAYYSQAWILVLTKWLLIVLFLFISYRLRHFLIQKLRLLTHILASINKYISGIFKDSAVESSHESSKESSQSSHKNNYDTRIKRVHHKQILQKQWLIIVLLFVAAIFLPINDFVSILFFLPAFVLALYHLIKWYRARHLL